MGGKGNKGLMNFIPMTPMAALIKNKGDVKKAFRDTGLTPMEKMLHQSLVKDPSGKKRAGGGGGGGKVEPNAAFYNYLAQMQQMQQAQAASAQEAQQQAILESQRQAAAQAAQMGESAARQSLLGSSGVQSLRDANAMRQMQQQQAAAASQATGGGYDYGQAKQEALTNLGAAGGMLPATPANVAQLNPVNPATMQLAGQFKTPKSANIFQTPSYSDLKFGGA